MAQLTMYFGRQIDLNETYFLVFPDEKPELTEKEKDEYNRIISLPDRLKYAVLAELDPRLNPNIRQVTGYELVEITKRHRYIPQFDANFKATRKLTLIPASSMEFYIEHSKILKENS